MTNGWTGGQYSLFRAALAVHAAGFVAGPPGAAPGLVVLALALSVPLLLGYRDRWAALALAGIQAGRLWGQPPDLGPLLLGGLLLAHVFMPPAPWGSWEARARADAGSGWAMPPRLFAAGWIVLALCYAWAGYAALGSGVVDGAAQRSALQWVGPVLALLFAPLAIARRLRPLVWTAGLAIQLAPQALFGLADTGGAMPLLHFFTFDPAWVRARAAQGPATVFYDGHCGLCHRVVRFLLSEDAAGSAFRFAPLESACFRDAVRPEEREALPDSVVLRDSEGALLVRSAAILDVAERLGGIWRATAVVLRPVPASWLDRGYDWVAAHRQRVFGREAEACPRLPAELRARFLD